MTWPNGGIAYKMIVGWDKYEICSWQIMKKKKIDFLVYCDYYEIFHYISYEFKHLNSYMGINSLSYIFHISKEDTILEVEYVKPKFEIKEASIKEDGKGDFEE